jgi:cysteine desulfurase
MAKPLVYLDHAATSPMSPKVLAAILPYLTEHYGNAANLYSLGREAKRAVAQATLTISRLLNCHPDEIIFTASATESDQLALAGIARANKDRGNRIIISAVEHKGIFSAAELLKREGFEIVVIPVRPNGLLDLTALEQALDDKTILVSITMADSETGTIQPIAEIAKLIKKTSPKILFHSDATQAAVYQPIDLGKLGVDLLTASAHKLGGPKGAALLFVRRGTGLPRVHRGTENVAALVGFAAALEENRKKLAKEITRLRKLRDQLEQGVVKSIPKVVLNGHRAKRLPNFCNLSILDVEGEALLLHLDNLGIMVGTGSACNSESLEPSAVLVALGNPYEFVHGSIRFTLGPTTKSSDIKYVLKHLPKIAQELRRISPLNLKTNQKEKLSDPRAFVGGQTPHFLRKAKK